MLKVRHLSDKFWAKEMQKKMFLLDTSWIDPL